MEEIIQVGRPEGKNLDKAILFRVSTKFVEGFNNFCASHKLRKSDVIRDSIELYMESKNNAKWEVNQNEKTDSSVHALPVS